MTDQTTAAPDVSTMTDQQFTAAMLSKSGFDRAPMLAAREAALRAKDPGAAPAPQTGTLSQRQQLSTGTALAATQAEAARQSALEAEAFRPAASPIDFVSTVSDPDAKPEALHFDTDLREALHRAEFPAAAGNALIRSYQQTARAMKDADPVAIQHYLNASNIRLQQAWGDQLQTRVKAVSDFVDQMAEKSSAISHILERRPYLLADPLVMQQLWTIVERRNRQSK